MLTFSWWAMQDHQIKQFLAYSQSNIKMETRAIRTFLHIFFFSWVEMCSCRKPHGMGSPHWHRARGSQQALSELSSGKNPTSKEHPCMAAPALLTLTLSSKSRKFLLVTPPWQQRTIAHYLVHSPYLYTGHLLPCYSLSLHLSEVNKPNSLSISSQFVLPGILHSDCFPWIFSSFSSSAGKGGTCNWMQYHGWSQERKIIVGCVSRMMLLFL